MKMYKLTREEMELISNELPDKVYIGYLAPDDTHYYTDSLQLSRFSKMGINIAVIINNLFSISKDEFLDAREVHKYKIYNFIEGSGFDPYEIPYSVDFKTALKISLHKKLGPKTQGKPTYVEYYETKSIGANTDAMGNPIFEYTNLICKIDFELTYDAYGFILKSKELLKWAKEDNTIDENIFKDIGRVFDPILDHEARIQEGVQRRQSIVDGLQIPCLGYLKRTWPTKSNLELLFIGRAFLDLFEVPFKDFVDKSLSHTSGPDIGKKIAYTEVRDYNDATHNIWLDAVYPEFNNVTARQYILSEFNI